MSLSRAGKIVIVNVLHFGTLYPLCYPLPTLTFAALSFMLQHRLFQKLVPDASEEVKPKTPRPLPKDRTRAVARSSEVDAKKGLLTQTQLAAFLER